VEPQVSRGPTISQRELGQLRSVERVVRKGKVRAISTTHVTLDDGELQTTPGEVYVDCTAAGVRQVEGRPVFEPDRLTLGYVTIGVVPWGAAIVAAVEAMRDDDREKNRLCPPLPFNGNVADSLPGTYFGLLGAISRGMEPDIDKWNDECRLYPAKAAKSRRDDPQVAAGYASMIAHIGPAVENLQRRVAGGAPAPRDPGLQHTNVT
jgi:hypothetical protein